MRRSLGLILIAAMTVTLAGASLLYAGDCQKNASAASSGCSAAEKAGCCAKMAGATKACPMSASTANAGSECAYCGFVSDLKAQAGKVQFITVDTKDGVQFVFAGVGKDDVAAAQAVATKAYTFMSTPSHCAMSAAQMTEKMCGGCKERINAFTGAKVLFENTKDGAKATVKTSDKAQLEKLHAFAKGLLPAQDAAAPQS